MRCDDVIRELAVPSDDRNSAALAGHLASCPQCDAWAQRDSQFDRLWDATRPVEPSAQVWDEVWSQLAASLDASRPAESSIQLASPNGSATLLDMKRRSTARLPRSRSWKWVAITLVGLAQAAAVLFVVRSTWWISAKSQDPSFASTNKTPTSSSGLPAVANIAGPQSIAAVEIEAGQSVVIRVDDSATKVVVLTHDGISSSVDDWYLVFNAIEAIANPVVAMKE